MTDVETDAEFVRLYVKNSLADAALDRILAELAQVREELGDAQATARAAGDDAARLRQALDRGTDPPPPPNPPAPPPQKRDIMP